MHLLTHNPDGKIHLVGCTPGNAPPYAVLSHTWGPAADEIMYQDIQSGSVESKAGFRKLQFLNERARRDGIQHFWIDTCCIDTRSSAELSETIISSFSWYRNAQKCYVFLSDVSSQQRAHDGGSAWELSFQRSRWFTRGWTLQELLAPQYVEFFSREADFLGTKQTLIQQIHGITGIPIAALEGASLMDFTVAERLSWATSRQSTRVEDQAYCLLGIFDVSMPLLYGEGDHAMRRLMREIEQQYGKDAVDAFDPSDQSRPRYVKRSASQDEDLYLQLEDQQFRLLKLDSGKNGDPITGEMHVYSSLDPPPYYALSYVWGHEPKLHQISINNCKRSIQPNLFHALQRFKSRGQITIWVDAICIDQDNKLERSMQVKQMSQIYSGAEGVLIWLGEEDSTSQYAFDFLSEIKSNQFRWDSHWWETNGFLALSQLLERPWFRRVWVIQEAAFSKYSTVFCGDRDIYLDQLITHMRSLRDRLSTVPLSLSHVLIRFHDSPAFRLIDTITNAFRNSLNGDPPWRRLSLEALVELSVYSQTTDARDAIYALLNLANDIVSFDDTRETTTIVPDYTKSAIDVFGDFIAHCCSRSGSLDIICRPWAPILSGIMHGTIQDIKSDQRYQRLPSWIISREHLAFGDPSRQFAQRVCGNSLTGRSHARHYNAHYGRKPRISLQEDAQGARDGSLKVRGLLLGQVCRRSGRMADAIITRECIGILRGASLVEEQTGDGEDIPDVIWRTLCADTGENGARAPHTYGIAMAQLLHKLDPTATTTTLLLDSMSSIDPEEILEQDLPHHIEQFATIIRDVLWNRRTFTLRTTDSSKILVGLIPRDARVDDHICILYGCKVPVVLRELRKVGDVSHWQLIGEAYVHGIMDGEVISSSPSIRNSEVDFIIV